MKLFEQPLDKLFSPKAMKQLNQAIKLANYSSNNEHQPHGQAHTSKSKLPYSSTFKQNKKQHKRSPSSAYLWKFFLDANNNSNNVNNINRTCNDVVATTPTGAKANSSSDEAQNKLRNQLMLAVLPEPIRNLLNELYLRAPTTVGIFRKSPNAKHCRELRLKLEADSKSSIEHFQVTVIASVFKEWLRSLPDCLLMSRLYPQWIDVAKLIEPLHQYNHQQLMQLQQSQSLDDSYSSQTSTTDTTMMMSNSFDDTIISGNSTPGLRPSQVGIRKSPLTDNVPSLNVVASAGQLHLLSRAQSCSTMALAQANGFQSTSLDSGQQIYINGKLTNFSSSNQNIRNLVPDHGGNRRGTELNSSVSNNIESMSAFALAERRSECLRIVRQLLDNLNKPNLILLRSFMSVLWHIADNSDFNKMSASNLGVCVGQSLLNDEHQTSAFCGPLPSIGSSSTFGKRHRRSRSHCLLSSTLSLSSSSPLPSAYLESNSAQETAKYVPILVAFMIENASDLFGQDIIGMFDSTACTRQVHTSSIKSDGTDEGVVEPHVSSSVMNLSASSLADPRNSVKSYEEVDTGSKDQSKLDRTIGSIDDKNIAVYIDQDSGDQDETSYGAQKRQAYEKESTTSSSRASSSTSGIHSESPAFSNESESQNARAGTSNSSVAPSIVSSPSPITSSTSSSPVQGETSSTSPVQEQCQVGAHLHNTSHLNQPHHHIELDGRSHHQQHRSALFSKHIASTTDVAGMPSSPANSTGATSTNSTISTNRTSSVKNGSQNLNDSHSSSTSMRTSKDYANLSFGLLSRAPKIPVQFGTSSYGGETVIYNPKPMQRRQPGPIYAERRSATIDVVLDRQKPKDSVISVEPVADSRQAPYCASPIDCRHEMAANYQQELRDRRLSEFLAAQSRQYPQAPYQYPLVSAPSLPYLAQTTSQLGPQIDTYIGSSSVARRQHAVAQQQAQLRNHQGYQLEQAPIFYSTTNLSSLQYQQQYDRYLWYHRNSLKPQRSHVMSLRDYYLSLHQQQQQQHLQSTLSRNRAQITKTSAAAPTSASSISMTNPSAHSMRAASSQPPPNSLASSRCCQKADNHEFVEGQASPAMVSSHVAVQRPQPRLAKIRQNHFNHVGAESGSPTKQQSCSATSSRYARGVQVSVNQACGKLGASSGSSSEDRDSSDESDGCLNDGWTESTMV